MRDLDGAVRKNGLVLGLLFGALMLIIDILKMCYLAYAPGKPIITFIVLYPVYYIVFFGAALLFISRLRNNIGRFWNLKQAITGIFIMLFVSSFVWNNGLTVFSGYVAPELAQKAHTSFIEARKQAMASSGTPAKKMAEEEANMQRTFEEGSHVTIGSFFRSLAVSAILVFAVSALLGILFKREGRPTTDNG
ncbi:DUF4199 domain-containing protein [Mucilaginibacter daejeonensis]|uniref:DUF4199 domain-containing protein n=1 Tax=Mucilaginibacter daejeonensis TaxID=398049 RepID=UPI001D17B28C|nr:DUF4199 domain-containing protein [Mucilaginibacter daejeonensis]UEG52531.1 DUF4199 domain-containing protein [Mucilaginibacter daejeonensis]